MFPSKTTAAFTSEPCETTTCQASLPSSPLGESFGWPSSLWCRIPRSNATTGTMSRCKQLSWIFRVNWSFLRIYWEITTYANMNHSYRLPQNTGKYTAAFPTVLSLHTLELAIPAKQIEKHTPSSFDSVLPIFQKCKKKTQKIRMPNKHLQICNFSAVIM